jgi:hypothetical protein
MAVQENRTASRVDQRFDVRDFAQDGVGERIAALISTAPVIGIYRKVA